MIDLNPTTARSTRAPVRFNVSLEVPAEMVDRLPDMVPALVPEREIAQGRWVPAGGLATIPTLHHAQLDEPPPPGERTLLLGVEATDMPPLMVSRFVNSHHELTKGESLARAARGFHGDGVLNMQFSLPHNEAGIVSDSALVLIPRQPQSGNHFTPRLIECARVADQDLIHVTVTGKPDQLDAGAAFQAIKKVPLYDRALALPWVSERLLRRGISGAEALAVVDEMKTGLDPVRMTTADGRKRVAAGVLLTGAMFGLQISDRHGQDAMDELRLAVAQRRLPELSIPLQDQQNGGLSALYELGMLDPFSVTEGLAGQGRLTQISSLQALAELFGTNNSQHPEAVAFREAVRRQPKAECLGQLKGLNELVAHSGEKDLPLYLAFNWAGRSRGSSR